MVYPCSRKFSRVQGGKWASCLLKIFTPILSIKTSFFFLAILLHVCIIKLFGKTRVCLFSMVGFSDPLVYTEKGPAPKIRLCILIAWTSWDLFTAGLHIVGLVFNILRSFKSCWNQLFYMWVCDFDARWQWKCQKFNFLQIWPLRLYSVLNALLNDPETLVKENNMSNKVCHLFSV